MKWINSKVTWDIETGAILEREGFWYDGPMEELKPGKSQAEKTAESATSADLAKQGQLTDAAQGTLSQFEGPVQQSPFYNALLTTNTEATSDAYQNAQKNVRARANQAGFGYNQPVEQGAEAQVGAQEAKDLAEVPGKTMIQATQPALAAAGETAGMGMGYGSQGAGFNKQAGDMETRRGGIWNTLLNTAASGAATGARLATA